MESVMVSALGCSVLDALVLCTKDSVELATSIGFSFSPWFMKNSEPSIEIPKPPARSQRIKNLLFFFLGAVLFPPKFRPSRNQVLTLPSRSSSNDQTDFLT